MVEVIVRGRRGRRGAPPALLLLTAATVVGCADSAREAAPADEAAVAEESRSRLVALWSEGQAAFGVFVPNERPRDARAEDGSRLPPLYTEAGGAALAAQPLIDYLFLNLEGGYDAESVRAIVAGVRSAGVADPPTLLVRIPPISEDGEEAAGTRVAEALALGADGVVIPHVRSPEEATAAVGFFEAAGADVWGPSDPDGSVIAMIMIEDPGALAAVQEIADVPGYSVLACGIGSLTRAMGNDREGAEAGNQEVLRHSNRIGVPNMTTATAGDIARRVEEGFLGLLMFDASDEEAIRIGREAAGR